MESFEAHLLGPNQGEKAKKKIRHIKSYVRKFLLYMSGGDSDINSTLLFLNDMVKLNGHVIMLCPLEITVITFMTIFTVMIIYIICL